VEISAEQYQRVKHCLPTQRGNVDITNLDVLNAVLYIAENGCKWRALPKRFGELAYHLHAAEPLGQEGCAGAGF
jgi:transposase